MFSVHVARRKANHFPAKTETAAASGASRFLLVVMSTNNSLTFDHLSSANYFTQTEAKVSKARFHVSRGGVEQGEMINKS